MTIGTGFFGRCSLAENLAAASTSCNWTRIAYAPIPTSRSATFDGPRSRGRVASPSPAPAISPRRRRTTGDDELRDELRRLILEELRELVRR